MTAMEIAKRPNGFNSMWTPEMEAKLITMHDAKHTAREISIEFGTTRNSIIGKLTRMGLSGSKIDIWEDAEVEYLKELWLLGGLLTEITDLLNKKFGLARTMRGVEAKCRRLRLAKRIRVSIGRSRRRTAPAQIRRITMPVDFKPLNIPFLQVASVHCREVVGNGSDGLAIFCGHAKEKDKSFCPIHSSINYRREYREDRQCA